MMARKVEGAIAGGDRASEQKAPERSDRLAASWLFAFGHALRRKPALCLPAANAAPVWLLVAHLGRLPAAPEIRRRSVEAGRLDAHQRRGFMIAAPMNCTACGNSSTSAWRRRFHCSHLFIASEGSAHRRIGALPAHLCGPCDHLRCQAVGRI